MTPRHHDFAVCGEGIAAACATRLLSHAGHRVAARFTPRDGLPVILLSPATQRLLGDIFQDHHLFDGSPVIRRRVVQWGQSTAPTVFPHNGCVIEEARLRELLWAKILLSEPAAKSVAWSILHTHNPADERLHFGSRQAITVRVRLRPRTAASCWIESLNDGWLFLLSISDNAASLIAVGDEPASLLERSSLIAGAVEILDDSYSSFPCHPSIAATLCDSGFFRCGAAAMSFDPLCGEGTGNAAREAILAAAAVRAIAAGADPRAVLSHYSHRLLAGFHRHLEMCLQFYAWPGAGPWWQDQVAHLKNGLNWAGAKLRSHAAPQFQLTGFELQPISKPA